MLRFLPVDREGERLPGRPAKHAHRLYQQSWSASRPASRHAEVGRITAALDGARPGPTSATVQRRSAENPSTQRTGTFHPRGQAYANRCLHDGAAVRLRPTSSAPRQRSSTLHQDAGRAVPQRQSHSHPNRPGYVSEVDSEAVHTSGLCPRQPLTRHHRSGSISTVKRRRTNPEAEVGAAPRATADTTGADRGPGPVPCTWPYPASAGVTPQGGVASPGSRHPRGRPAIRLQFCVTAPRPIFTLHHRLHGHVPAPLTDVALLLGLAHSG